MLLRRLVLAAATLLWVCPVPAVRASAEAVALIGTWHVIAHYKDSTTANADSPRWEDRVWVFQREGDRIRWSDYPIVVLQDDSGRFEGRSRVLAHWEPNAGQRGELANGPTVNSRGSKSKTLRGSAESGWKSVGKQQRSVSFITYEENWSIEDAARPVFTRADVLGSAGAEDAEGRTLWQTETVEGGGDVLRGKYDRDGTRLGSFVMTRVGDIKFLSTDGPTPNEKQAERVREEILESLGGEQP
jgi:hypothetical protein